MSKQWKRAEITLLLHLKDQKRRFVILEPCKQMTGKTDGVWQVLLLNYYEALIQARSLYRSRLLKSRLHSAVLLFLLVLYGSAHQLTYATFIPANIRLLPKLINFNANGYEYEKST